MAELHTDVSALYVDPRGPYPGLVADWWGETRDARLYTGPNPVVAHPPCGPWGALKHLSAKQDPCCGPVAVTQVRSLGGVLEHPKGSGLFAAMGLPRPGEHDAHGFILEVNQCAWGHVARKTTWLYIVGLSQAAALAGVRTGGTPTHWVSGGRNPNRKGGRAAGGLVPPGIKVCSAEQRRRTPPLFATWLIELAALAGASRRVA